ncbi:acyl-CoA thioesterase [Sandaracinus amylolyticus]|uniref:4-hydroxybenzoyl-CoA thioesterase family active site protein n=1 Tax=Sandaracinus amylolyticus TaxID=927083 RepID=A0A0F6VZL4_9BACT|nr:thioesterase family protein [Sandaracinus amylolyticus]AKF03681.1 4-hydroxybenzoyl-CoA thioesterase family active site protein [Sandaracinus amylolyticus]
MDEPRREDFTFFHPLRVRWAEVDRQDVVFNPNYFVYFDLAVGEYWRAIGFRYPQDLAGTDVFAIDARASFRSPARYDDEIEIGCRVTRIGRSSKTCELAIWRGAELLTTGTLVYVHVELATRKSCAWPDAVRDAIVRFERVAPVS